MNQPKMKTSAPLSPDQIRAVIGDHKKLVARRRYLRVRTVVRVVFWSAVLLGIQYVLLRLNVLPDDYKDTCAALGQTCKP